MMSLFMCSVESSRSHSNVFVRILYKCIILVLSGIARRRSKTTKNVIRQPTQTCVDRVTAGASHSWLYLCDVFLCNRIHNMRRQSRLLSAFVYVCSAATFGVAQQMLVIHNADDTSSVLSQRIRDNDDIAFIRFLCSLLQFPGLLLAIDLFCLFLSWLIISSNRRHQCSVNCDI